MSFNMDELLDFIDTLDAKVGSKLEKVVEVGKQSAENNVPVDTGALRASIHIQKVDDTHYQLIAGTNLPDDRAIANEYGTHNHPAQPYMQPAVVDMQVAVDNIKDVS